MQFFRWMPRLLLTGTLLALVGATIVFALQVNVTIQRRLCQKQEPGLKDVAAKLKTGGVYGIRGLASCFGPNCTGGGSTDKYQGGWQTSTGDKFVPTQPCLASTVLPEGTLMAMCFTSGSKQYSCNSGQYYFVAACSDGPRGNDCDGARNTISVDPRRIFDLYSLGTSRPMGHAGVQDMTAYILAVASVGKDKGSKLAAQFATGAATHLNDVAKTRGMKAAFEEAARLGAEGYKGPYVVAKNISEFGGDASNGKVTPLFDTSSVSSSDYTNNNSGGQITNPGQSLLNLLTGGTTYPPQSGVVSQNPLSNLLGSLFTQNAPQTSTAAGTSVTPSQSLVQATDIPTSLEIQLFPGTAKYTVRVTWAAAGVQDGSCRVFDDAKKVIAQGESGNITYTASAGHSESITVTLVCKDMKGKEVVESGSGIISTGSKVVTPSSVQQGTQESPAAGYEDLLVGVEDSLYNAQNVIAAQSESDPVRLAASENGNPPNSTFGAPADDMVYAVDPTTGEPVIDDAAQQSAVLGVVSDVIKNIQTALNQIGKILLRR